MKQTIFSLVQPSLRLLWKKSRKLRQTNFFPYLCLSDYFSPKLRIFLKKKPGPLINGILNWATYLYLSSHLLLPLGTNPPLQTLCVSHFSICSLCDVKYAIEIQVNTVFLKKSTDNPSLIFTDFEVTSSFCPIINFMLTCRKKLVHKSTVVLYAGKKIKYLSE